jgi:hypothetical protein
MSSSASSRQDFLIGKAGAEQITQKLTQEDPRIFLANFQAANGILPENDTYYFIPLKLIELLHSFYIHFMPCEAKQNIFSNPR